MDASTESATEVAPTLYSRKYRNYVLAILTGVYTFNFIDRQILVILQESIKQEMGLSDSQLAIMSGVAFAIFYVCAGLPIARWADKGNRRNIVVISLTLWSGMTALCGFAQNYWQLLAARIGVGVGEAGGSPPSHSMISDYFPFSERGTALSIYSTGIYIGILFGFLAGGWINEYFGWRVAFLVVGVPGILWAVIVRFTVKEPPRGHADGLKTVKEAPPLKEVLSLLWGRRSFRFIAASTAFTSFSQYGTFNFMPSFLYRSHDMTSGEIGTALALIVGLGGALGTYLGGRYGDKLGAVDARWYVWIGAAAGCISLPISIVAYLVTDTTTALALYVIPCITSAVYLAPSIAISHALVPAAMRSLVSAVLFFVLNIIGLGLGPLMTGAVSDYLAPELGAESLRYALVATSCVGILGVLFAVIAGRYLKADLEAARADAAV